MNQVLMLQIPEELYQPLVEIAQRRGQSPEEFTIQWLAASIQQFVDDPLEQFIGAVNSGIPDWSEHHDQYLGQTIINSNEAT